MSNEKKPLAIYELKKRLRDFMDKRGSEYGLVEIGFFGSYAREEAVGDSDVDIVYHLAPGARQTLFDLVLLREELVEALGRPVDLIEFRDRLKPELKRRIVIEATYV